MKGEAMAHSMAGMVEILEQDQHHLDLDRKYQIESFLETSRSLRDILLLSPCFFTGEELQKQVIYVAYKAEAVIEVYIRNQILLLPPPDQDHNKEDVDSRELDLTDLLPGYEVITQDVLKIVDNPVVKPSLPLDHLNSEDDIRVGACCHNHGQCT